MAWGVIEPLTQPLEMFLDSVILFFPKIVAAVILLAIGWGIGSLVGRIVKELMLRFKIDQHISKKGSMLRLSDIFPIIFEWVIYLVFIKAAVEALGIQALIDFVGMVLDFIPGLLGAIIIVIVGYVIAGYVQRQIEKSKIIYSAIMGKILFWLIIYIAVALALPLVRIDATLINNLLLIIVGSIGIGLAIAIGLGLKDVIAIVAKKKLKQILK